MGLQVPSPNALLAHLFKRAAQVDASNVQYVHQAQHRHHLRLRPDETPELKRVSNILAQVAQAVLPAGAGDGLVTEFGALLTGPGAKAQNWHSDLRPPGCEHCSSECSGDSCHSPACGRCLKLHGSVEVGHNVAPIYSCQMLVSSAAAVAENGVLQVKVGSHSGGTSVGESVPSLKSDPGVVICFDGTALHRGSAHTGSSDSVSRVAVYISVMGKGRMAALGGTAIDSSLVGSRISEFGIES